MTKEDVQEAHDAISTAVKRFYTIRKAHELALRNCAAGVSTFDPNLKQVFKVAFTVLKKELETCIDKYISGSGVVGEEISSKVLDIYSKCLQNLRSFNLKEQSRIDTQMTAHIEYYQPILVAKELADLSFLADQFYEDMSAVSESDDLELESEEFS